jgi:hypothetical protein
MAPVQRIVQPGTDGRPGAELSYPAPTGRGYSWPRITGGSVRLDIEVRCGRGWFQRQ